MNNDEFMKDLLEDSKQKDLRRQVQNLMFFDLETGKGEGNNELFNLRAAKIRKNILAEKYTYREDWGESANQKHASQFEERKSLRIAKEVNALREMDAVNPYFCRICVICWKDVNGLTQITELELSEEEMVRKFWEVASGKTLIGYNSKAFDLLIMQLNAAKYRIEIPQHVVRHIDVMDKLKVWGIDRKPLVVGQKVLAAVLGAMVNKEYEDVDPASIGDLFSQARGGMTDELKQKIEEILRYSKNDVLQLEEIYWILKSAKLI